MSEKTPFSVELRGADGALFGRKVSEKAQIRRKSRHFNEI